MREATMLVFSGTALDERVQEALQSAARGLGYEIGCAFADVSALAEGPLPVYDADPWAVVAVDDAAVEALRAAFGKRAAPFAPDAPVRVDGYRLVAVPDFAECLDDLPAKRVAWQRLQAAKHPGNPLG